MPEMNYYVDIYSNLLSEMPAANGGVLDVPAAEARLNAFHESSIKTAVCAPYYRPDRCGTPAEFLARRDALIAAYNENRQIPHLVGGAVLPLSYCLEEMRGLSQFVVGSSEYLLVDLPMQPVTEEFCETLTRLRIVSGLSLIAVDIDRYYDFWSLEDWLTLRQNGMLLQISVDGLLSAEQRKLSLYLLANQLAHFVATGGRDIREPLRFTEAMRFIQRSLPAEIYRRIKNNAGMLLSNAEPSVFV
ncbi:MAG: hypothetical protein K6E36_02100 [Oscillospiraceae bacterium]|nr:hypothetical protein [Oscillospiraceae bacterium]MCR5305276.1 hypothetical protein [Oscillospiraceae bacterium]